MDRFLRLINGYGSVAIMSMLFALTQIINQNGNTLMITLQDGQRTNTMQYKHLLTTPQNTTFPDSQNNLPQSGEIVISIPPLCPFTSRYPAPCAAAVPVRLSSRMMFSAPLRNCSMLRTCPVRRSNAHRRRIWRYVYIYAHLPPNPKYRLSNNILIPLCFCDILFSIEQWSIINIGGISIIIAHTATSKGGKR